MSCPLYHLYPSDQTNRQWEHIKALIPPAKAGGRPRTLDMRLVINAILYVLVGGIAWRMLPREYPNWKSVYHYFRAWREDGIHPKGTRNVSTRRCALKCAARRANTSILQRRVWTHKVSKPHTSRGCVGMRGFDNGKKVKGRKRHLLVDTLGLMLLVLVTSADVSDPAGARRLLLLLRGACKKLRLIWVDGAYRGTLLDWVSARFAFRLQPVLRSDDQKGFVVLPKRWLVERTLGWLGLCRRLSKDYEELPQTSETFITIAMIRLMTKRL